tara:strand:+ start:445 stop:552 length:108 start_codon:yes stop_codon:yes gene_type:complete
MKTILFNRKTLGLKQDTIVHVSQILVWVSTRHKTS